MDPDITIGVTEDRAGTVGIRVEAGKLRYVGSIETAERLAATLAPAIQETRCREEGGLPVDAPSRYHSALHDPDGMGHLFA